LLEYSSSGSALNKFYTHDMFSTVRFVSMIGAYYRIAVLMIELKQGFYRIIDLDVDDYQAKSLKKTAESKGKK